MKKLIIAPHVDDEVLGCGGVLDKDCFVYYCGIDESKLPFDKKHRIPLKDRKKELEKVSMYFGFFYDINYKSKVNYYTIQEFITKIEDIINHVKPDMIFIPHNGYNQDHQVIHKACKVALRPHDKIFFVKKVLIYEAIHDFIWSDFQPNCFFSIDIKRKNDGYSMHKSQVRGMRDKGMLSILAKARGMMCNYEFAEGYKILRWII